MNMSPDRMAASAGLALVDIREFWKPVGLGLHCSCHDVGSVPITIISLMRVQEPTRRSGWAWNRAAKDTLKGNGPLWHSVDDGS